MVVRYQHGIAIFGDQRIGANDTYLGFQEVFAQDLSRLANQICGLRQFPGS
jgi:hypothetical protein